MLVTRLAHTASHAFITEGGGGESRTPFKGGGRRKKSGQKKFLPAGDEGNKNVKILKEPMWNSNRGGSMF